MLAANSTDSVFSRYYTEAERLEIGPLARLDRFKLNQLKLTFKGRGPLATRPLVVCATDAIWSSNASNMIHACTPSTEEPIKWLAANPPKILGQGTFGRVYEAIDENGEIIAVKQVQGAHASRSKSIAALQKEMMTLRLLRHCNIIQYKGFEHHPEDESILFLMEVSDQNTLFPLSPQKAVAQAMTHGLCSLSLTHTHTHTHTHA
jgi:hypothetical protein